jgi:hypothetical protein
MSINTVEIRAFTGPATVELAGVGIPEIVEVRQGPAGPTGPTGPAGPAGPNSVTSATTSDGTCALSISSLVVGFGSVGGSGSASFGSGIASGSRNFAIGLDTETTESDSFAGGRFSLASGQVSYAFGVKANAIHDGASVESDSQDAIVESTTTDEKTFRFQNGYRFLGGSATFDGTLFADHIHGNIAGSVYAHVRAGETLAKGDPVYISGSHGSGASLIAIVSKADASDPAKMPAVGIMDAAVANNANGHMVITGTITELDTNAYAVNTVLYVASGGGFTATPPAANSQPVAIVERANTNNGAVIVKANGLASSGGNGASDANKLARFSSAGTLPISNIGGLGANVATFLTTPTSANLAAAVTDETGTGSLVFSNAPTLTGGLQFSTAAVAATTRTNLGVLQTRSVVKASDETRTSTTLAADSDLVIALDANSIYKIELYYFHVVSAGAISARADYTGTLLDTLSGDTAGTYHGFSQGRWTWAGISPPIVTLANGTTATPVAWLSTFSLKTGDAGNFRLSWSAGNGIGGSSGTAIIKQGSRIIATKLL